MQELDKIAAQELLSTYYQNRYQYPSASTASNSQRKISSDFKFLSFDIQRGDVNLSGLVAFLNGPTDDRYAELITSMCQYYQNVAINLINAYFELRYDFKDIESPPPTNKLSEFKVANNYGFLCGIIEFGTLAHLATLIELFKPNDADSSLNPTPQKEKAFIGEMFDFYIRPFHMHYTLSRPPSEQSSNSNPRPSSAPAKKTSGPSSGMDSKPPSGPSAKMNPKPPSGPSAKKTSRPSSSKKTSGPSSVDSKASSAKSMTSSYKAKKMGVDVQARDMVCLFCWEEEYLEVCHIIAQKNVPFAYDEANILWRAGLEHADLVQNGLYLCTPCHKQFDRLKVYVETVDSQMELKLTQAKGKADQKGINFAEKVFDLRKFWQKPKRSTVFKNTDYRQLPGPDGEFILFFVDNDQSKLPNKEALLFHKAACHIWQMAGGAEPQELDWSDDDDEILVNIDDIASDEPIGYSNPDKVRSWTFGVEPKPDQEPLKNEGKHARLEGSSSMDTVVEHLIK